MLPINGNKDEHIKYRNRTDFSVFNRIRYFSVFKIPTSVSVSVFKYRISVRYLIGRIRYYSVFKIPTSLSVSVSVFYISDIGSVFSVYRPMTSLMAWADWPWPPYFTTDLRHWSPMIKTWLKSENGRYQNNTALHQSSREETERKLCWRWATKFLKSWRGPNAK